VETDQDDVKLDKISTVNLEDEMQGSYLEYAMSVIVGRALPEVRDGLKPVHRRILWSMSEQGHTHEKRYVKSARIVGDVIGKYHPHGDVPVYGAMVRMAQDFAQHYTLIDGQGNFGSVDGDNPAAMRYTEARMTKLGGMLLKDIEKDTVNFGENYDGSLKEPKVLPSRIPNLLINGSSGIAVGMSTNIPPHNLTEVVEACVALIDNPEMDFQAIHNIIKGPDFPTAGIVMNAGGFRNAYQSGRGSFVIKGRAEIEPGKKDRECIIVTELPYMVNKANWIQSVANLVRNKVVEGITDIRDESNKKGNRVVIDLKRGESGEIILNTLYAKTQLKTSFGIQFLAIDNGRPRLFSIKNYLKAFIEHRRDVVTRRTVFELNKAKAKAHILEGLKIALDNIDEVVEIIKKAANAKEAKVNLIARFEFSEIQAQAILDMRLHRLTALETQKLVDDLNQILKLIASLKEILSSDVNLFNVIKSELNEILEKFPSPRKTEISEESDRNFDDEDFIKDEPAVVTVTNKGYAKRLGIETYKAQARGGKGVKGSTNSSDEDFVSQMFVSTTLSYLLCFTNLGRLHWLKVHKIPEMARTAKGRPLVQLVKLQKEEKILNILPIKEFVEDKFVFMTTKKGLVKKTDLMSFSRVRQGGIIAINFNEDDELVNVNITDGKSHIFIATKAGQSILFNEDKVRGMGRTAKGVRGISLSKPGDQVVGVEIFEKVENNLYNVLTVSEKGYGKQSKIEEYRVQGRGGSGIRNLKVGEKVGEVAGVVKVKVGDDLMLISSEGKLIRMSTENISTLGRSTQGVRLIKMNDGEIVQALAPIREENKSNDNEEIEENKEDS